MNVTEILNLTPGNEVSFLGLTWRFMAEGEQIPEDILFNPAILCNTIKEKNRTMPGVDTEYIKRAYRNCPYKIVIICNRDEILNSRGDTEGMKVEQIRKMPINTYIHKGLRGVVGIIFAKPYLDGIYISVTCSQTYDEEGKRINTKFGLILRTTMLNYARKYLDIKNAYNHAANKQLVAYYRKLNWELSDKICGVQDEITEKFNETSAEDLNAFLESDAVRGKLGDVYPMRLCDYNIELMKQELKSDIIANYAKLAEYIGVGNGLCNTKAGQTSVFSSSLVKKWDITGPKIYNDHTQILEDD